jgi:hypothetical protein
MKKEDERKIFALETSCLRRLLGVTSRDRIQNEDIRKTVQLPVEIIRRRGVMWFGLVSRMTGYRLSVRALHCYITDKRSRGRPFKKWINNIQEDLNNIQLNMNDVITL